MHQPSSRDAFSKELNIVRYGLAATLVFSTSAEIKFFITIFSALYFGANTEHNFLNSSFEISSVMSIFISLVLTLFECSFCLLLDYFDRSRAYIKLLSEFLGCVFISVFFSWLSSSIGWLYSFLLNSLIFVVGILFIYSFFMALRYGFKTSILRVSRFLPDLHRQHVEAIISEFQASILSLNEKDGKSLKLGSLLEAFTQLLGTGIAIFILYIRGLWAKVFSNLRIT